MGLVSDKTTHITITITTNSYIAHFTITVSMLFTLVPWSWGQ